MIAVPDPGCSMRPGRLAKVWHETRRPRAGAERCLLHGRLVEASRGSFQAEFACDQSESVEPRRILPHIRTTHTTTTLPPRYRCLGPPGHRLSSWSRCRRSKTNQSCCRTINTQPNNSSRTLPRPLNASASYPLPRCHTLTALPTPAPTFSHER
jgi:hypothetical protein